MDEFECQLCFCGFTESGGCEPRLLPCGHTFCFTCISNVLKHECPLDRIPFQSVDRLVKNRTLLNLMNLFHAPKKQKLDFESSSAPTIANASLSELQRMKEEIEAGIQRQLNRERQVKIDEMELIMADYHTTLNRFKEERKPLETRIQEIQHEEKRVQSAIVRCETQIRQLNKEIIQSRLISHSSSNSSSAGAAAAAAAVAVAAPSYSSSSGKITMESLLSTPRGPRGRYQCPSCSSDCKTIEKLAKHCTMAHNIAAILETSSASHRLERNPVPPSSSSSGSDNHQRIKK